MPTNDALCIVGIEGFIMIKAVHTTYTKTETGYEEVDTWVEEWPDPEEDEPQSGEVVWLSETHKVEWE